jgi:hypothetical protein
VIAIKKISWALMAKYSTLEYSNTLGKSRISNFSTLDDSRHRMPRPMPCNSRDLLVEVARRQRRYCAGSYLPAPGANGDSIMRLDLITREKPLLIEAEYEKPGIACESFPLCELKSVGFAPHLQTPTLSSLTSGYSWDHCLLIELACQNSLSLS